MMNTANGMTPADVAAVMNRSDVDGFGGNNGWWILIILFAIFGGWGNGSWGQNGGVQEDYILATDFANIERKIDGVNNGICDGFYAMNTGMLNGFAGVNNAICNLGYQNAQLTNDVNSNISNLAAQSALQASNARYESAAQSCATQNAINQAAQSIMQNDNANYRQLHDEIVAIQIANKDEKIAEQQAEITALNLAASQFAQNQYLINQLRPAPIPAYSVANPYAYQSGCCLNA
jgi:hypothetical protein